MGTPLTFWKLQCAPVLMALDLADQRDLADHPIERQSELLPIIRIGSLWIWLVALLATCLWSLQLYGPKAMAFAAWIFALSPNLLAHGPLITMEIPLVASTALLFWLFWKFLISANMRWFWGASIACGIAWSCKFTAVIYPPILAICWGYALWSDGERSLIAVARRVVGGMTWFVLVMLLTDLIVTSFSTIPFSTPRAEHPSLTRIVGEEWASRLVKLYETPMPQDWVGFAKQLSMQAGGGPSYLFGERRMKGWWYYYFVAIAVKTPVSLWILVVSRAFLDRWIRRGIPEARGDATLIHAPESRVREDSSGTPTFPTSIRDSGRVNRSDTLIPIAIASFLVITAIGSSRNYGIRYLLPLAPLTIVWISALAELKRLRRVFVLIGVVGAGIATATAHPYELTYFNILAGGPVGGRRILADSNLDWGQGLVGLARLQRERPKLRDLTLFYFGDTDPNNYGVVGTHYVVRAVGDHSGLPKLEDLKTKYVGVSASLQWGPWGPAGFFDRLKEINNLSYTYDKTIAVYRREDIPPSIAIPNVTGIPQVTDHPIK